MSQNGKEIPKHVEKKFDLCHGTNRSGKPIGKSCRGRGRKKGGSSHMNHREQSQGNIDGDQQKEPLET